MKKKIICIFVMTLLIVTASSAVGMMNVFPSNNSLIEKTGAEDYMMTNWYERQKLVASDGFGFSVSIDGDYTIVGSILDDFRGSSYVFKRDGTSWTKQAKLLASDGMVDDFFGCSVSIDGDYAIIGAEVDDFIRGSAYIFKRTGTSWAEEDKLTAPDGTTGDFFGWSVSIDGDYAIIGVPGDGDNGEFSGSAYVFKRDGTNWNEQDKLLASDGTEGDFFGYSVSINGDYAIIGALGDDGNEPASGSAYVFTRSGTTWTQQAKLLASDGMVDDFFGCSVSIDGDYAIIGAERDKSDRGAAYIFKRTGTSWAEEDKLTAPDGTTGDSFGASVSIDGDYAIIGAPYDDDNGYESGSAYVFKRDGINWNEQDKLLASDGTEDDYFGYSVSIDGDYAIIGALYDDGNEPVSGSAYVFKRDGINWNEQDKLLASDGMVDDWFGCSVSIDGDYAIIGAEADDNIRGSAYIFKRTGTSWAEEDKLTAPDGTTGDFFGWSVSIDGDYAIIGVPGDDGTGSAYIFKRDGTNWNEQDKLLASDGAADDGFGVSVSIDGDYAIIGAYNDDDGTGSAYVFEKLNQPPSTPIIKGERNGDVGTEYEYTFNAVDPNGDNVKYHIDWDDGDSEETGFNPSGTDVKVKHTWSNQGNYTIKATAEDTNGLVGPEGTLSITMPRNRAASSLLLLRLLEQFPLLREVLSRLITN